jgi:hypothetical protein
MKKSENSTFRSSSCSQVASSSVWWLPWTLHILMALFLVTLSDVPRPLWDTLHMRGLIPWLNPPRGLVFVARVSTYSAGTRETHHVPLRVAGATPTDKLLRPFILGFWMAQWTLALAFLWLEITSALSSMILLDIRNLQFWNLIPFVGDLRNSFGVTEPL